MAGRTVNEAVNNYRNPLKEVVNCVADPILLFSKGGGYKVGEEYALTLREGDAVQLVGMSIAISISQYFQPVKDDREDYGPFRVRTTAYYYTVEEANSHEILAYHWHPEAPNSKIERPHMQLEQGAKVGRAELAGSHIPTGRVTLEDFIRLLIEVFQAPPRRDDWREVLKRTEGRFNMYKSW